MKIRIDSHLTRFEVIRQLRELIVRYNQDKTAGMYQDDEYSFSDYLYSQSLDPVRRFLLLCIPEDSFPDPTTHAQMITYWTEKFQISRGMIGIFDYLREMGGVLGVKIGRGEPGEEDYVAPFTYDMKTLVVNFTEVETADINLFIKSAVEFFKALLYFQDLRDTYETLKLNLTTELQINLSAGSQFYTSYIISEDDGL